MKQIHLIIFLFVFSLSVNGQKLNFEALDKYFSITES